MVAKAESGGEATPMKSAPNQLCLSIPDIGARKPSGNQAKKLQIICLADVHPVRPHFPRVIKDEETGDLVLEVFDGVEHEIPDHPIKVIGLLHHLAGKSWPDGRFFHYAIDRIARVKGWPIHPFQAECDVALSSREGGWS